MKKFKHIVCIALSFVVGISYAQPASTDNITAITKTVNANKEKNDGVEVNKATSISSKEKTEIIGKPVVKIYPEPFLGIVSVNLSNCPNAKICVFDAKGNCLKYQNCKNEVCALFNLKNQPKGIYYMEILSQGEKTVKAIYLQ